MIRKPLLGLCLVGVAALMLGASCAAPAQPAPSAPAKQAVAPTTAPAAPKPAATTAPPAAPAATSAPAAAAKPTAAPVASFKTPQGWPNKPITLIVPWPGGGGADASMRLLGGYLEKVLGVSVQVLNKPGANSQIGLTELALAKPDGYTMGFVATPSNWTTYLDPSTKAAYNGDSFDTVAFLNSDPGLNFVKADSKYKTLKDLVDDAKARPNQITITTSGILSPHHLNVVLLEKLTGAKFRIVHFDGAAPEITAVLGGQVEVGTLNVATNLSDHIKNNALRILAVYADQRVKVYPDVPTAKEAGFPLVTSSDRIIAVPKGTPKEIVASLSRAIEQGTKDPDLVEKMGKMGIIFQYKNPEDTAKYWKENESVIKPLMSVMKGE